MLVVVPGPLFLLAFGQQVKTGEECRPDGQDHRHRAEEILDVTDDRFLATVGAIASVLNSTGRIGWGTIVDKLSYKVN